ncbi:MAG: hypothetical protein JWQ66_2131 [Mucilaginibacter sp.]|nr:hypothetical protein [Mucilaginibacter sp.]
MNNNIINFDANLSEIHHHTFVRYCGDLSVELDGKTEAEQEYILFARKRDLIRKFSGINLHDNIDFLFVSSLLLDLMLQGWQLVIQHEHIELRLAEADESNNDLLEKKAKSRKKHLLARDIQLQVPSVLAFIRSMHKNRLTNNGWHSIFSVMRDGSELGRQLQEVQAVPEPDRENALKSIVKPYIQFVDANAACEHTGLNLADIWRYFRHTWSNEYKSLPGRSISILIRDAAAPNHPVIGIAALGNSVAQQTNRDKWIGWDGSTFFKQLEKDKSAKSAKWILQTWKSMLDEIYKDDLIEQGFITAELIAEPNAEVVRALKGYAKELKSSHIDNPHDSKFTTANNENTWEQRAQTDLFKSKRANALSELLGIKLIFNKYGFKQGTPKELEACLSKSEFKSAIEKLIRKAKAIHVGINMMDIIVAGSIAPYNHLLGGKLVCMLLTSPEVVNFYNDKYGRAISLIASSMSGKAVVRRPQLVLLCTTSLYGVGSSQYNRIKIPADAIGGKIGATVEYKELGISEGYGSFHFSNHTIWLADKVVGRNNGRKRVNSIFGEGANPLLRKLRDAFDLFNLESDPILNHRNPRVVYGISLAENFGSVLLGTSSKPNYIFPNSKPAQRTDLIGNYWIRRWLQKRIMNNEVLAEVSKHTLTYPIQHGGKVPLKDSKEMELYE